jgi:hypothetical protein
MCVMYTIYSKNILNYENGKLSVFFICHQFCAKILTFEPIKRILGDYIKNPLVSRGVTQL